MRDRRSEPTPAAVEANRRGLELRAQGRLAEAAAAFNEGLATQSDLPELHANLGVTLSDLGRFDEARTAFEAVLALDSDHVGAHWALYELEQITGNVPAALAHQQAVLKRQTLFVQPALREQRRVLVLMAPGDWQANVPVDFLIDPATTTLHKLFVVSAEQLAAVRIPSADVIFNAIGESEANRPSLQLVSELAASTNLPFLNHPDNVLKTNRVQLYHALKTISNVLVPETQRVTRDELENGRHGIPYPLVIRPVDSHAGHNLARVNDDAELAAYCEQTSAASFYVMPFIEFASADGYYRKYRVIVVDGVPYPYHLAISERWMIHYYNTPMREQAWMRAEEERFLSGFDSLFGPALRQAFAEIATVLDLEYFGVDCSIDRVGSLVVFEADPAMIVHAGDDPKLFAYKYPYAERIFKAFEQLVDGRSFPARFGNFV